MRSHTLCVGRKNMRSETQDDSLIGSSLGLLAAKFHHDENTDVCGDTEERSNSGLKNAYQGAGLKQIM